MFKKNQIMKKLLLAVTVLLGTYVSAQNMVENPTFNPENKKPHSFGNITDAQGWSNANGGSVDLFDTRISKYRVGIPENYMGMQESSNSNYAGIIAYYEDERTNLYQSVMNLDLTAEDGYQRYSEYLQGKLTSPLVAGKTYQFSFKVSLAEKSGRAVSGLGAYFSPTMMNQESNEFMNVMPQIVSYTTVTNTSGWTEITGRFVAAGGEQYFAIGAFEPTIRAQKIIPENVNDNRKAYYYIAETSMVPYTGRPVANFEDMLIGKRIIFLTLNFETGKSDIKADSYDELNECARFLNNHPEIRVQINGHTDKQGDDEINIPLSKDRARVVKEYLSSKGVAASRMETDGYGSTQPIVTTGPDDQLANRRMELYIIQ